MTWTDLGPILGAATFLVFTGAVAFGAEATGRRAWLLPAVLSAAFFGFSLYTVATEGPTGFWTEHTRNLWGNQIWFDLLSAIGVGWISLVPPARSLGMRPVAWLIAVACTGSVGLLAMLARILYLRAEVAETRQRSSHPSVLAA